DGVFRAAVERMTPDRRPLGQAEIAGEERGLLLDADALERLRMRSSPQVVLVVPRRLPDLALQCAGLARQRREFPFLERDDALAVLGEVVPIEREVVLADQARRRELRVVDVVLREPLRDARRC